MAKKFYITNAIPYTNSSPHIGFALEIIGSDVIARYHRSLGEDVFYLTGTDEHGLKTMRAAEAADKSPEQFVGEISQKFKDLKQLLNLSNDDFIRTTDENRHWPAVEKLWKALEKSGDLYRKKYKGFYCVGCESFKTQKELTEGRCSIHQKPVEETEEENYFFKLSKYLPEIKTLIEKDILKIIPARRKEEVIGMIKSGLEDISFSRSKDKYWGFQVPGDPSQIIYVWADALPNYISAIGYANNPKNFKKYWPADVHYIGKDIVKFHALYWPAMLLSLGLALPKIIFTHGFITVGGQKMSKSLGNIVDPFELVKKYGVDAVRYYLLREITPTEDGDFTIEKFEQRYNSDLAGGIGNLLARTVTLAEKFKMQKSKIKVTDQNLKLQIKKTEKACNVALEEFKFNESLKSIWELISFCDKYINQEKPWEGKKNASQVISDVLFTLNEISELLAPFLPETSEKMKKVIKSKKSEILFPRLKKH